MLLTAEYLESAFGQALPYDEYLATGSADQQSRWQSVFDAVSLSDEQRLI